MATYVLKNCKLYVDGYDLSGDMNQMGYEVTADAPDNTVFGATSRGRQEGGLTAVRGNFRGFYQANSAAYQVDDVLDVAFGAEKILTVCPTTGADGEVCYTGHHINVDYRPLQGTVGDMAAVDVNFDGSSQWVRGTVLKNGTVTADGNGTAYEVGAVAADEVAYAAVHVLSVSASDDISVTIESDDTGLFSSPTTQITFTANMDSVQAEWKTDTDTITDTYWRAVWDVTDTDVSIQFVVVLGIK